MEDIFKKTKNLIDEYDELERAHKILTSRGDNIKLSYVDIAYDGPGLSYSYFNNDLKNLFISAIENRMSEIKKIFN